MRAEVIWHEMPAEVRAVVEPLVMKHGSKLPLWVASLSIGQRDTDEKRVVAFVDPEYQYRQVRMFVTPLFLVDNAKNRERTIIHEFLHVPVVPIRSWIGNVLDTYVEDEDVRKLLFEQYHDLEEGCVQDLTFAFSPPKPPR